MYRQTDEERKNEKNDYDDDGNNGVNFSHLVE